MAPIRLRLLSEPQVRPCAPRTVLLAGAFVALVGGAFVGCDTGAIGIESCRAIETARCEAAPACFGDEYGTTIETEEQVENCKVFYRDHCLVGLETTIEPDTQQTDACVVAVEKTAACETANAPTMAECADAPGVRADSVDATPCQVLAAPERLNACAFVETQEGEGGGS